MLLYYIQFLLIKKEALSTWMLFLGYRETETGSKKIIGWEETESGAHLEIQSLWFFARKSLKTQHSAITVKAMGPPCWNQLRLQAREANTLSTLMIMPTVFLFEKVHNHCLF